MKFPEIEKAINEAYLLAVESNGAVYEFAEYAFGERGTHLHHGLISEIISGFENQICQFVNDFDLIISPDPGGHAWGLALGHVLNKDVVILRNSSMSHKGVAKIVINGYSEKQLNYVPIDPDLKAIIVDDVISSGKTVANILENIELSIMGVFAIYSKNNKHLEIASQYKVPTYVLVD